MDMLPPPALSSRWFRWTAFALCGALLLAGCGQRDASSQAARAPASAVMALSRDLAAGDLVAYARASVPPEEYAALQKAWADGDTLWPLTGLPLDEHLPRFLQVFSDEHAVSLLRQTFDQELAGQATHMRNSAQALGVFGVEYITRQADYSTDQRTHYRQLVQALSQWSAQAPLTERELAYQTLDHLADAIGSSGLDGAQALQALELEAALTALVPVQGVVLDVLSAYGLDLRATLNGLQATVLSEQDDQARVQVSYRLADRDIRFEADMVRRDGRWYMAQNLADAARALSAAAAAKAQRAGSREQDAGTTERAEGETARSIHSGDPTASGP